MSWISPLAFVFQFPSTAFIPCIAPVVEGKCLVRPGRDLVLFVLDPLLGHGHSTLAVELLECPTH